MVHRIEKITVLDEPVNLSDKEIDKMMKNLYKGRTNIGIFQNKNIKPQKIKLRFEPSVKRRVIDRQWHPTQKITNKKDGSIIMELKIGVEEELVSWITQWRDGVVVIAPKELKIRMKDYGKFLNKTYKS